MGRLHHVPNESEHGLGHHLVLHRLQTVPGQGDQRDPVQELPAKRQAKEPAHTHRKRQVAEQLNQCNDMKLCGTDTVATVCIGVCCLCIIT